MGKKNDSSAQRGAAEYAAKNMVKFSPLKGMELTLGTLRRKNVVVKAWAGFEGGKLQWWPAADSYNVQTISPAIYPTRKAAKCRFQDVRRIEIRIVK